MIPEAPTLVTDPAELAALAARLRRQPWFALDTEFLRERTYYPRLGLIQVADPGQLCCIDPLALDDLTPLTAVLSDQNVIKVVHAASQDLEILLQETGVMPRPLFDTQVAAALLGHPDQIGYARLVTAMLGTTLAKAHTRTDWTRRPLGAGEIAYAADDVRYLAALYPLLRQQLEQRGRLGWLEDECRDLTDPARYRPDPALAWRRFKGIGRLPGAQQQALAQLAAWRERTAMAADRPRRWIIKDEVLTELARRRPSNEAELGRVRDLPQAVLRKHGPALLDCIAAAPATRDQTLAPTAGGLDPDQLSQVDLLMTGLRARAAEIDIGPATLASRKDMEALVAGERELPLLRGWRRAAAGQALLGLLEGRLVLHASAAGTLLARPD